MCSLTCDAGIALAAPHRDIYSGLWGYNSVLSCIAIGGVFYGLTWQSHTLALTCGKPEQYDYKPSLDALESRYLKNVCNVFLSSIFLCIHDFSNIKTNVCGKFESFFRRQNVITCRCLLVCHALLSFDIPSQLGLPACTWPFCLSTLIFLLLSSENPAICRLPLSAVSYPEENRCYLKRLKVSEKDQRSSQEGASMEIERPNVQLEVGNGHNDSV